MQEADLVCMSKSDLYPDADGIAGVDAHWVSAKTGQGVEAWLDEILFGSLEVGRTTLEIDYQRYARAEAALAWLNLSFTLVPIVPVSPALTIGPFLDRLDEALSKAGIPVVHLKMFDGSESGWVKAAVCGNGEEPRVEGNLDASPAARHEFLVNLRAKGKPGLVRRVVEEQLQQLEGKLTEVRLDCFSPAAPKPERRVPRAQL